MPIKRKNKIELPTQRFEQNIGQECNVCQQKLMADACISICDCFLYCHEQCFVKKISPFITEKIQMTCAKCKQKIKLTMKKTVYWICNKSPRYLIAIFAAVLCLIAMFILIQDGAYRIFMPDEVSYSMLAVAAVLLIVAILKSMRRKFIRIEDIKVYNTNRLAGCATEQGLIKVAEDAEAISDQGSASLSKLNTRSMFEVNQDSETL